MGTQGTRESSAIVASVLALLVVLAVFALAACGGTGTPTPDPTPEPTPTPSEAAITVSPTPSWSPTMSPAPIPMVKPGQKPPPFSELKVMFAYDTAEPLGYVEYPECSREVARVTLRLIEYQSGGEIAAGYLVMP